MFAPPKRGAKMSRWVKNKTLINDYYYYGEIPQYFLYTFSQVTVAIAHLKCEIV